MLARAFPSGRKTLSLSLLGLALFLAVEALLLRHYVRVDTRPPSWDQSVHLEIALDYREAIAAGRWSDLWYLPPKPGMPPFPPAYHLLLRGAYDSADPARAALWYNWLYLAVLAVSLFAIARGFLPDARALAAALLFCAAPGVQELYATQLADLAVVAWTAAAYWALLECRDFKSWRPSLAFGALFGVGMLHKWSFFSYFLPAYLIAWRALGDRAARPQVLAAAALAATLFAPWYWSHIALLPSRLVQASADFAVPFWRGGAWLVYPRYTVGSLGLVLAALGVLGLISPRYARRRERAWVLAYWLVSSYVFWTLVPNRQGRFLLPALAPLGLALGARWPRRVVWGAVLLQLAGAVNFFYGWVGPFDPIPFLNLPIFASRPPSREDWKVEAILRTIDSRRDAARPLTNVTLVANDTYFNGPTLHWTLRRLGLERVNVRGVNRRLCELSEFVLVKDGRLGPESVIAGLPEAAREIGRADGWFRAGYAEVERWPLPDGSAAVLYAQRRGRPSPIGGDRVVFGRIEQGDDVISGLRLSLDDWVPALSAWKTARASVASLQVRGLVVRNLRVEARHLALAAPAGWSEAESSVRDVRLLRLDRLAVNRLEVRADDFRAFLQKRVPGLALDSVVLDRTIRVSGRWKGAPVSLEAALDLDRAARVLRVRVLSARVLGLPLQVALFRPIKELEISLDPNPETPFAVDLPGITIKDGRLTVP